MPAAAPSSARRVRRCGGRRCGRFHGVPLAVGGGAPAGSLRWLPLCARHIPRETRYGLCDARSYFLEVVHRVLISVGCFCPRFATTGHLPLRIPARGRNKRAHPPLAIQFSSETARGQTGRTRRSGFAGREFGQRASTEGGPAPARFAIPGAIAAFAGRTTSALKRRAIARGQPFLPVVHTHPSWRTSRPRCAPLSTRILLPED
jgi:hypothetical protein